MLREAIEGWGTLGTVLWGMIFVAWLVGVGWVLRAERRAWVRSGKGTSALALRILALPILAVCLVVVLVPAYNISGMEALAYFYVGLLILGPIVWFGLHAMAGALLRPRLVFGESFAIAALGLGLVISPFIVATALQRPVYSLMRLANQTDLAMVATDPLAHEWQPLRRFRLGESGELRAQTLRAPNGIRIERLEANVGGWTDTATVTHPYVCRQGEDLHLSWAAGSPPPPLRLYWRDAEDRRRRAEFVVDETAIDAVAVEPFFVDWRDDGFELPFPLQRLRVWLAWHRDRDGYDFRSLDTLQPGESWLQDCVGGGYRRVARAEEGPILALLILALPSPPVEPWRYEVPRPEIAASDAAPR